MSSGRTSRQKDVRRAGAEFRRSHRPWSDQAPLRAVLLELMSEMFRHARAVRTVEIARPFGVSEMTAVRDLACLATGDDFARVHGGLVAGRSKAGIVKGT